ncbi:hypothetical protein [Aequorivita capsosiphonis]|uniref:hypothetical protein n=1 Tax=Aequorivita capsosiphonis TaxID=487317 RepID=UPI000422485D|nr:hypothetical protein [Aequorivita capsosiphonis]
MHPYIPHLLSDIAAAHQKESKAGYLDHEDDDLSLEELFADVERYIAGKEEPTFAYYCGLESIDFPPPEQLDDDDLKKVCKAFEQMMQTWNLSIALPDNLPLPFAYHLTVDMLNTKTNIPKTGMITFDFCSGYAPDCDLKSYCPCLEFWNECDDEMEDYDDIIFGNDDLPF